MALNCQECLQMFQYAFQIVHKFKLQSKELEIRSGNCQLPFVFGISMK